MAGKHRGRNEGSIYKRQNGRYGAMVSIDGRRISSTHDTKAQAQEWIRATRSQMDAGLTFSGTQVKLSQWMEEWLTLKSGSLAYNTLLSYRRHLRLYIIPKLGKYKLSDITPARLQHFYRVLELDGVTTRPIQITHSILHGAFKVALQQGLLSRNPAQAAIIPTKRRREIHVWDEAQVSAFLIFVKGEYNEYLYHLAIATGMRRGELLGLQWDDIDWHESSIHVQRQAVEITGQGTQFISPKTEVGRRTIQVGANTLNKLRLQFEKANIARIAAGGNWHENGLVFPQMNGDPIPGSSFSKQFRRLLAKSDLPALRFHDLRHTAASLMLNHGIPVLVVSNYLGHSKTSITLDTYGHLIPHHQEAAAALMDSLTTPVEVDI